MYILAQRQNRTMILEQHMTMNASTHADAQLRMRSYGCSAALRRVFCAMKIDGEPDIRTAGY
jgi:hypothetical protein